MTSKRTLIIGAGLWLVGGLFFAFLAVCASFFDYLPADLRIAHAIQGIDVPAFGGLVGFVNFVGDTKTYLVIVVVCAIGLGVLRAGWESILVVFSIAPAAIGAIVKGIVQQPRPSPALIDISSHEGGSAFPSGHVLKTSALFLLLFVIIPAVVPWRPVRWLLQAGSVLLVVSAGPARVYDGAHWPSDVVGGYVLAILLVGPVSFAYLALRGRSGA